MSEVTLELVQARQAELAQLIEQLKREPVELTRLSLSAITIPLDTGEHYAGAVLDEQGQVKHHLVLMAAARPAGTLDWHAAMYWANSVAGALPTRQEQALLYANCKPHLTADWHWSCETEGSSYAWGCDFGLGTQYCRDRSAEGCAVAVRRLTV